MGGVLLATDGSEYARRAAGRAIELAAEHEERLYVICVVDERRFVESALGSAELATIYAQDDASLSVREVTEMAERNGVSVEGATRHGTPHEVILDYADEVDADVVLMGAHGAHDVHLSGVREKVLEESDREVRIVEPEG